VGTLTATVAPSISRNAGVPALSRCPNPARIVSLPSVEARGKVTSALSVNDYRTQRTRRPLAARVYRHKIVGGRAFALLLVVACTACGSTTQWDGRRGYDGSGDYGYDVAASSAEARSYRQRAAGGYPTPGTSDDPWGPYIQDAAYRFHVPERWVREVMQQESGGSLYDADGFLITSRAGAMGLMQVMPRTYDILRERYGLGSDPYEPHNNILAGTAYIREMYDRYGAPGFLAAYDAGPDRLDAYISDGSPLPDETISYLSSVAPRLGNDTAMTGPLAAFAGNAAGVTVGPSASNENESGENDPSLRAFDGGGLVTAAAPTGVLSNQAPTAAQAAEQPILAQPVLATLSQNGNWGIQVGAYSDPTISGLAIERARASADDLLLGTRPAITPIQHGTVLYRARLMGLSPDAASAACARLSQSGIDCVTVPPGS
jgi:D-alanyl-D-alanine carboxypeptidase